MDNKFEPIMSIIIIAVGIIFLVWGIYILIIFFNNKLYCKHFYKKEWNLWEKIIEKLKKQEGTIYVSKYDNCPGLDSFHIDIEINSEKYKLIYWVKTKTASVWHGTHCILCGYDKYHSDMAIETIKERIKKVFNNADEETKQITKELMSEW